MCCKTPSLRRESAIIEFEPVGPDVPLVIIVPLPAFLAVEAGARPDHPIIEANSSYIARGAPFARLGLR